ncbi:helix-turn-helix domain-containing protein [Candidatus Woesearchaeota archaeon]|nr:helix-turn-helix domain-containing protein [Candidatus Woesearchaeota archaeon]
MWVGKFRIKHKGCWIIPRTLKYDIEEFGYTLSLFEKDGQKYHTNISWIKGSDEEKNKFFKSLRNDKRIIKYKRKGNQLYTLIKLEEAVSHAYDSNLFFVRPIRTYKGFEYWELGSWDKRTLNKFYTELKKFADVNILKLKKEFPAVFIQHYLTNLTDKQAFAIECAYKYGYYMYPKKISIKELANKLKIPRTTLQNHLKKAESKIMNVIIEDLK